MKNKEYRLSEEEFAYIHFALGQPEAGEFYLKETHPRMKWDAREKFLLEGKRSLIARGLVSVHKGEFGAEDLVLDPDLKEIFEYGTSSESALQMFLPTASTTINIYFKGDGKWMAQLTLGTNQISHEIKSGDIGEITEFILGLAGLSKPPAPEFPAEMKFDILAMSRARGWPASKVKQVIGMEEPWLSEIADTFYPNIMGMIARIGENRGQLVRDSHTILFMEGPKYSWVICFGNLREKGEILTGGKDRLKAEILKLLE